MGSSIDLPVMLTMIPFLAAGITASFSGLHEEVEDGTPTDNANVVSITAVGYVLDNIYIGRSGPMVTIGRKGGRR